MKRIAIALIAAAGVTGMVNAQAQSFFDNARVRSVEPQYENVSVPREACTTQWVNEQQRVDNGPDRNYAALAIGGLAGGVLGNQVGKGSGRAAATAIGAVVGALVGDRVGGNNRAPQYQVVPREVTTCNTVNEVQSRVNGYRVAYDYHGQVYNTVMPRDPGQYVQVRVSVDPVVR